MVEPNTSAFQVPPKTSLAVRELYSLQSSFKSMTHLILARRTLQGGHGKGYCPNFTGKETAAQSSEVTSLQSSTANASRGLSFPWERRGQA